VCATERLTVDRTVQTPRTVVENAVASLMIGQDFWIAVAGAFLLLLFVLFVRPPGAVRFFFSIFDALDERLLLGLGFTTGPFVFGLFFELLGAGFFGALLSASAAHVFAVAPFCDLARFRLAVLGPLLLARLRGVFLVGPGIGLGFTAGLHELLNVRALFDVGPRLLSVLRVEPESDQKLTVVPEDITLFALFAFPFVEALGFFALEGVRCEPELTEELRQGARELHRHGQSLRRAGRDGQVGPRVIVPSLP
jgi:hypothetical protein